MDKVLRGISKFGGIIFLCIGSMNLYHGLWGHRDQWGMTLPVLQAGAWGALGVAVLLVVHLKGAISKPKFGLFCGLAAMSVVCCIGGYFFMWHIFP